MAHVRTATRIWTAALLALAVATDASANLRCESGDGDIGKGKRLRVVGLTGDGRLVCFKERDPIEAREIGAVTGLGGADTALVGIDFRVQDGLLYGVGNGGGVYTIDTATAVATFVNQLSVALAGTSFGVDFNPAADRLRIVSDTGQNLRHNVNPGGTTATDADLNYAGVVATGVTGAAYTNNDLDALTATTLFDVDSNLNQVAVQSPPNNGSLAATGKLGVDPGSSVGFDVYSRLESGVTTDNRAFASLVVDGTAAFYAIDLLTGAATLVGPFPEPIVDVAVPLNQ